ncbi:DUF6426 family protein [Kitasatospora sp. NPDC093550]|uniref:DUF6426 family protein n=1 Tax=Kitasatospora sp. NPDC093550 TaxID=3364089 RepID=UPI003812D415
MQLKRALGAVALGVTVLTAVPALVVPQVAAAADCYTNCDPWDDPNRVNDPIIVTGANPPESSPGGVPWYGGGGGSLSAHVVSVGEVTRKKEFCKVNTQLYPVPLKVTIDVFSGYKVSSSLSASVVDALKASIGAEFSSSRTLSYSVDVKLLSGQSYGLFSEHQTITYAVTMPNGSTQMVDVDKSTGTVIDAPCS